MNVESETMTLKAPLGSLSFVSLDFETTGLSLGTDRIIEIGASKFSLSHESTLAYAQLCNPNLLMSQRSIDIHHITQDMVNEAPSFARVLPSFLQFLAGSILIAHHAAFDVSFLLQEAKRLGLDIPSFFVIDTFPLAKRCCPGLPSYALGNLLESLNLSMSGNAHRALPDAIACGDLFKACVARQNLMELSLDDFYNRFPRARLSTYQESSSSELSQCLQQAILAEKSVSITYMNSKRQHQVREITPSLLGGYQEYAYVDAYCHLREGRRRFYLKRITELTNNLSKV